MPIDSIKKSSRFLQGRRYTHDVYTDAQEAFTSVLDLNASEIYTDQALIPSSSLPYSGSSQSGLTYSVGGNSVMKYWYRQNMTKSDLNNEVWFFLNPSGSTSGIGAQLIDANQQTSFISPKYSVPSLANASTEDNPPGYLAKVFIDGSTQSTNNYAFDYKTGVLEFSSSAVAPTAGQVVSITAYQYIGRKLTNYVTDSGSFDNRLNQITGSFSTTSSLGAFTASFNAFSSSILSYTASNNANITSLNAQTASLLSYTSSINATISDILVETASINRVTASLQLFTASIFSYTASNNANITALNLATASLYNYTASNNANITSLNTQTASLLSYTSSLNAKTGSFATTGSNIFTADQTIQGTLTVNRIVVQTVTASQTYSSGSNIFGNSLANTQVFTGSVAITGSLAVNGFNAILSNQTSSMSVATASFATSASFAVTASHVLGGASTIAIQDEGSPQGSADTINFVGSGVTATVGGGVATVTVTGSGGAAFPYTGSAQITGSLGVTGSLTVGTEFQVTDTGVRIGNTSTDTHSITGSTDITGSLSVTGLGSFGTKTTSAITDAGVVIYRSNSSSSLNLVSTSDFSTTPFSGITFSAAISSSLTPTTRAKIVGGKENSAANNARGYLAFHSQGTEAFRINSDNVILIGTSGSVGVPKLLIGGTATVSSGTARGQLINTSFSATGNGDNLVALDINPTFTLGAFTGSNSIGIRSLVASGSGTFNLYMSGNAANFLSGSTGIGKLPSAGTQLDILGSTTITGSLNVSGSITTTGTITAQTLVVQTISSSIIYSSGSNVFGNSLANTQVLTGSVDITGSLAVNGSNVILSNQTSSMSVATASFALNGGVTQILAGPNVTIAPTDGKGQVTISATGGGGSNFNTATGSYGSFYDTTTQTNVAGTARSMSFNTTDITNGVSISGSTNPFNTYIKTENAGVYNIQFSAQVDKSDAGADEIWIWLRKNGTDLTDTATSIKLTGNADHQVAAWNFFANAAANDYFQLIWYSPDANVRLHAEPAFGVVPGIPSVIATVNRVDQFLSNTGSFSGSFNGNFTGSLFGTSSFATSASYAATASYADNFTVGRTLTAQTLVVQTVSSSVIYSSGSNIFGNSLANTQTFTGSVGITGSLNLSGSSTFTGDMVVGISRLLGVGSGNNASIRMNNAANGSYIDFTGTQIRMVNNTNGQLLIGNNSFSVNQIIPVATGGANITFSQNTATSGNLIALLVTSSYNQTSGGTSNTDFLINRAQAAVGSGSQYLIDARTNNISQFNVSNVGTVTLNGSISGSQPTNNPSSSLLLISGNIIPTGSAGTTGSAVFLNTVMSASANNQTLVGLDINPAFNNGAFTGVSNIGLRLDNSNAQFLSNAGGTGTNVIIGKSANGNQGLTINGNSVSVIIRTGTDGFGMRSSSNLGLGAGNTSVNGLQMFSSTKNVVIQNSGTFTDNGARLQVNATGSQIALFVSGSTSLTGSLNVSGSITTTGTLTAQTLVVQTVSSSIIYSSGSNVFGNDLANTQVLTGSVAVTGSLAVNGSNVILSNQTSSMSVATASLASAVVGGFAKSFAIINNSNIQATDVGTFNVWRANTPCTASMILGYRDTGSTAAVSASKNGLPLLSAPLTLSSNDTWVSSSVLQNQNFNTGDILAMSLVSFTGPTNEITIQVSFTY